MPILIKRYANRKLYNTESSRYITLKGIAELIEANEEVRVVDNETGEDITSVTLSQILLDSEREGRSLSGTLLSDIMDRGGDALYDALQRGLADATGGLDELHQGLRRLLTHRARDGSGLNDWIAYAAPDFERSLQKAAERVFETLDLPRRSEIEALNAKLERVAEAIEALDSKRPEEPPRGSAPQGDEST